MSFVQPVKSGLESVQNGRNYLDTLANRFVVKPKTVRGIGGFVFDYESETTVQLQADITDHFAENNTSIQDHIAQRPARINLRGFVAELAVKAPEGLHGLFTAIQSKLGVVPAYLGDYTPQALQKVQAVLTQTQSVVNRIDQGLARVKNIVQVFDNSAPEPTKQAKAYAQLEALYLSKQVFVVETPYKMFDNMVIESLSISQDETTRDWSDISVGLKQVRFAEVRLVADDGTFASRTAAQRAAVADKGKTKGQEVSVSALKKAKNVVSGFIFK